MSETYRRVLYLVNIGEIMISDHGYDELAADGIFVRDIIASIAYGLIVEDYPDYHKGSCVLVLQKDRDGKPVHVVWGIPKDASTPAVLITAYRPDPLRWNSDFLRRKR